MLNRARQGGESSATSTRPKLPLDKTSRLVARLLGTTPDELVASFRPATMADLPLVLALRAENMAHEIEWDDDAYLRWRYSFGRPDKGGGNCWVLMREGRLLGIVGTEALGLTLAGERTEGFRIMDILIQSDLEGMGVGAWLLLMMKSQAAVVLAVGSNANSKRLATRVFDGLPNRRMFIHPIRFDHFMAKRLKLAPLGWLATRMANLGMRVATAGGLWGGRGGVVVRKLDELPADLEALLTAAVRPDRVEVQRSRAQLSWRLSTPRARFELWGAWKQGTLVGLMITRPDTIDEGRQAWIIMDVILSERMQAPVLKALLWRVLGSAYRQGVDYVKWVSYRQDIERQFVKAGFVKRDDEYKTMVWACAQDSLRRAAEAGADWSFSELHTDGG